MRKHSVISGENFVRLSLGVGELKPGGAYHGVLAVGSSLCAIFHGFFGHSKFPDEAPVFWPGIVSGVR